MEEFLDVGPLLFMHEESLLSDDDAANVDDCSRDAKFETKQDHLANKYVAGHLHHELPNVSEN